jgi:quinol monooxygenase YgiN
LNLYLLACCFPSADHIIVVLTLTVTDEDGAKEKVIDILKGLQRFALSTPACLRFDICHNVNHTEVLINQTWATQEGLDAYYSSNEFASATPKFAGLLADAPDERVYQPV